MRIMRCSPYATMENVKSLDEEIADVQQAINDVISTTEALQAQIIALEDELGDYSPVGHNHDGIYSPSSHLHTGVYSPVTHEHDDWRDIIADRFIHLTGGSGSQSISTGTITVVELDTVVWGNSDLYDDNNNYGIKGQEYGLYCCFGQVYWVDSSVGAPLVRIEDAFGRISSTHLVGVTMGGTGRIQCVGLFQGATGGGMGIRLKCYHNSGSSKSIDLGGQTWLSAFQIGSVSPT